MKIPEAENSIQALIDKAHEGKESGRGRPHLGCSTLGHVCDRWLWLSFRWAVKQTFPGRILRVFRRGNKEEDQIIADLRMIGIHITGTINGKQARVDFGSHVSGAIDGVIEQGVPEAPKTRHIAEFKTHSLKSFKDVQSKGVQASKKEHYVQMQLYMHGTGIDRALYLAVCKDDDQIYTERVHYDKEFAEKYVARGHRITLADRMPPPISTDPSWFECRFCAAHEFCHVSKTTKEVNCRTCANATPLSDSTWHCAKWDDVVPTMSQHEGCESHVLHPDLVPWQRKDSDIDFVAMYEIEGVTVANGDPGEGVYGSKELLANVAACSDKGWQQLHDLRSQFNGRIVE
jgi:hypothetical protein